jgi:hypothetical protein
LAETSEPASAVVTLLQFTTTVANMIGGGGLRVKVGRQPTAIAAVYDSNPQNPLSSSTFRTKKISGSTIEAREVLREEADSGFAGMLGFVAVDPRQPSLYLEVFDLRPVDQRPSDAAATAISLRFPIKLGFSGKIQVTSPKAELGMPEPLR